MTSSWCADVIWSWRHHPVGPIRPYLGYHSRYRLNCGVKTMVYGATESNGTIKNPLWRHPDALASFGRDVITHLGPKMDISRLWFALSSKYWCLNYGLWGHWNELNHLKPSMTSFWCADVICSWRHLPIWAFHGHTSAIIRAIVSILMSKIWSMGSLNRI